jgi:hypothetical protein
MSYSWDVDLVPSLLHFPIYTLSYVILRYTSQPLPFHSLLCTHITRKLALTEFACVLSTGAQLATLLDTTSSNAEPNSVTSSSTRGNSSGSSMDLPQLAVPRVPRGSDALGNQQRQQQQQQQEQLPHRPERLPRCSTVSLQTELATPALVVFSGGTAFNSVAGECEWEGGGGGGWG